jgi:predicted phage terminase large subunit-like protein
VVDDPVKPLEVTKIGLDRCLEWWDGTMSTRQADARTTARVIMMQRLHESDLAGAMIERGGYEVLRLPMRYEKANPCVTVLGMPDPRTEDGELLDPARAPEEEVKKLEEQLGPQGSAAQLQQRPTPASGGIFAKEWLENTYIDLPPAGVIDQWCMSVDCTFKRTDTSDFVCISVWARQGTKFYLADLVNERLSFTETLAAIERMSRKWPMCLTKLVEDAANGPAVVDVLAEDVLGLELVPPRGGKVARAHAVTPLFRTGRVLLPHDAPWVKVYKSQMSLFPFGANDDMVDSTSQGLSWMFANLSHLESAMAAVRKARGK